MYAELFRTPCGISALALDPIGRESAGPAPKPYNFGALAIPNKNLNRKIQS